MAWLGTGIAPPRYPPGPTPPRVHPSGTGCTPGPTSVLYPEYEGAVGLISVDQLTLSLGFSGFQGMTEVYNLFKIGRINNHYDIRGFE